MPLLKIAGHEFGLDALLGDPSLHLFAIETPRHGARAAVRQVAQPETLGHPPAFEWRDQGEGSC